VLAPSDFSALKNFVRKHVHENRSKLFQWFKITSNQLTVNDVICDVVFVNNNTANYLLMNFDCPVDTSSSKTARQHTELVSRRTNSKPTAQISLPKTSGLQIHPTWTPWITVSGRGGNVGGLSQAPSETKNDRRTEGSPAGDLGQPYLGTNRQSCQRVLKATEGLCCSWGWTFRTFTVTAMSWLCYFCLNDVILLRDCLDIFERAKITRWQHCNADNFRTLLANYMLIRLLCAHEMSK